MQEAARNNADPKTVEDDVILLKMLDHICDATQSFSAKFNFSIGDATVDLDANNKNLEKYWSQWDKLSVEELYQPAHMQSLNSVIFYRADTLLDFN